MKTCWFSKMYWDRFGYNIEVTVNITRWLFGFGWVSGEQYYHINFGPMAIGFYKNLD